MFLGIEKSGWNSCFVRIYLIKYRFYFFIKEWYAQVEGRIVLSEAFYWKLSVVLSRLFLSIFNSHPKGEIKVEDSFVLYGNILSKKYFILSE